MKPIDFTKLVQERLGVLADGDPGAKTLAALDEKLPATGVTHAWPKQSAMTAFYGPAGGADCTAGRVSLPFPFPLAWDQSQKVSSISCHRKVAGALSSIIADAAAHYGEAKFRYLRLDRFGGCYNFRPMREGTSLSTHAWGVAVDLDPERNQLKWGRDNASFARPEYEPFWKIVESYGAVSLGRARNYDWMHFQFATL